MSIKRISGQRHNAPRVEGARIAARYLSKYVAKTFDSVDLGGRHRYEVGQGFQPQAVRFTGISDAEVLAQAVEVMDGRTPSRSWASVENDDWQGPPARCFDLALDRLKDRLADPSGDRVVEALRIARDVGGGDLGRVLRSLSGFLRDDLRTRSELEARQSWTVNAARLSVAAPWVVLLAMSLQRDVVARYSTTTGAMVLGGGAVVCVVAYRLMLRLGRLPMERRVLA